MRFWFYGLVLLVFTTQAWAADCGDTTGPGGTRVACQCGDRVTTNTKLQRTDPIVSTSPTDVCAGDGLEVRSQATLDCNRLTLRGSGVGGGISFDSTGGVTIENCKVTGFEIGIDSEDCVLCTIQNNKVSNNDVGILCGRDCILGVFVKNNIFANTGDGMSFNDSSVDNEVRNNHIRDNGGDGLVVGESCIGNLLLHNVVSGNDGRGISIEGDGNTIIENTGKRNGEHGLAVETRLNVVTGNEFNLNGGHGICGSPGSIDGGGNIGKKNGVLPDVTFSGCSS